MATPQEQAPVPSGMGQPPPGWSPGGGAWPGFPHGAWPGFPPPPPPGPWQGMPWQPMFYPPGQPPFPYQPGPGQVPPQQQQQPQQQPSVAAAPVQIPVQPSQPTAAPPAPAALPSPTTPVVTALTGPQIPSVQPLPGTVPQPPPAPTTSGGPPGAYPQGATHHPPGPYVTKIGTEDIQGHKLAAAIQHATAADGGSPAPAPQASPVQPAPVNGALSPDHHHHHHYHHHYHHQHHQEQRPMGQQQQQQLPQPPQQLQPQPQPQPQQPQHPPAPEYSRAMMGTNLLPTQQPQQPQKEDGMRLKKEEMGARNGWGAAFTEKPESEAKDDKQEVNEKAQKMLETYERVMSRPPVDTNSPTSGQNQNRNKNFNSQQNKLSGGGGAVVPGNAAATAPQQPQPQQQQQPQQGKKKKGAGQHKFCIKNISSDKHKEVESWLKAHGTPSCKSANSGLLLVSYQTQNEADHAMGLAEARGYAISPYYEKGDHRRPSKGNHTPPAQSAPAPQLGGALPRPPQVQPQPPQQHTTPAPVPVPVPAPAPVSSGAYSAPNDRTNHVSLLNEARRLIQVLGDQESIEVKKMSTQKLKEYIQSLQRRNSTSVPKQQQQQPQPPQVQPQQQQQQQPYRPQAVPIPQHHHHHHQQHHHHHHHPPPVAQPYVQSNPSALVVPPQMLMPRFPQPGAQ